MRELSVELLRGIPKSGPTDPIEFYLRPLVGRLFRERINLGLRLLPARRFGRALEIGYGAGAVALVLADAVDELHGIDLDADPERARALLAARGKRAAFVRGDACALPYAGGSFDLAVSFSVFEHLHGYRQALAEVARVLAPEGLFLLGMPSVNLAMEAGFRLIGFRGIGHHHVTPPAAVERAFGEAGLAVERRAALRFPPGAPLGPRLYHAWLLRAARAA